MKSYFRIGMIASLFALPLFAATSRAADKDEPKAKAESGHNRMAGMMKEKLGLSDEQAKKLEEAWKGHREAAKPLREQLQKAIRKVHGELEIGASDKDIQSALDQADKAQKALRAEADKFKQGMESILNATQRAKMLVMREKMMRHGRTEDGRQEGWRGHGGREGQGGREGWNRRGGLRGGCKEHGGFQGGWEYHGGLREGWKEHGQGERHEGRDKREFRGHGEDDEE